MTCCSPHGKADHHLWLGLIAFVVGAVILLQKFDIVPDTTWGWLWPAILVVVGLKFMVAGCCCCEDSCKDSCASSCCKGGSCDTKPAKKATPKKKKVAKKKKK